jgi:hypothetical protein
MISKQMYAGNLSLLNLKNFNFDFEHPTFDLNHLSFKQEYLTFESERFS